MLSEEELAVVLSVSKLALPADLQIKEIKFEERDDSTGEPIIEVYAIFDDAVPDEVMSWARMEPVYEAIRTALLSAGETRYMMFTVMHRTDFDDRYNYDPAFD